MLLHSGVGDRGRAAIKWRDLDVGEAVEQERHALQCHASGLLQILLPVLYSPHDDRSSRMYRSGPPYLPDTLPPS